MPTDSVRISRRAFLQAAGLTTLASAGGAAALGIARHVTGSVDPVAAQAPDRIGDLAAVLGYDVEAIFRFVADEVRYEPYTGVLRGARGTLAGRAGNSADQALLLAALLDASLVDYRFAIGPLDAETANGILAGAEASVDEARRHAAEAIAGLPPGIAPPARPELDPELQAAVAQAAADADAVVTWARDELSGTVRTITDSLGSAGIDIPVAFTPIPEREQLEHVWVQVDSGTEWLDLDPTPPGATLGTALTSATTTPTLLPEGLAHGVELALVAERVRSGALAEESVLRVVDTSEAIAGKPIMATTVRPAGMQAVGVSIAESLTGEGSYVPAIQIGDEAFLGHSVGFSSSDPSEGVLGTTFPEGETTALWLEVILTSPDRAPVTARRALFDRVGPGIRRSGTFDPTTLSRPDTVDLGDGGSEEVLPALSSMWLVVGVAMPSADDPVLAVREEEPEAWAVYAQALHLVRDAMGLEAGLPAGVRAFPDAPNVHAYSFRTAGSRDEPTAEVAIDILHRSFGHSAVRDAAAHAHPAIVSGVLAHVAERVLMGDALPPSGVAPTEPAASVGRIFDAAREAGVGLRVLTGPDAPRDLDYPEDARAVLDRSLAEGWVAVVPERGVQLGTNERIGWWLIDPSSGRTVDQLDDGRGSVPTEYAVTLTPGQLAAEVIRREIAIKCITGTLLIVVGILNFAVGGWAAYEGVSIGAFGGGAMGSGLGSYGLWVLRGCLG